MNFIPEGVIPACLMPWAPDMSLDRNAFKRHVSDVAAVRGVKALCVNGHASEVTSCTEAEQAEVLDLALESAGLASVISGVCAEGGLAAARLANQWTRAGASALLVFPPSVFAKGAQARPEMVFDHFARIADQTGLPLIVFQYPASGPLGYSLETLTRLVDKFPTICAIKDYSGDPVLHQHTIRTLQNEGRRVAMLTSHSAWLLPSLALGCAGILSGAGSTIAPLQVALFEAMERGDIEVAREVNERMGYIVRAFYRGPSIDQHNRMKEAQVLMGKMKQATVRPPIIRISDSEIQSIREALIASRLLEHIDQL